MKIRVEKSVLQAMLKVAAKLDVRYYLNGVLIEPTADGSAAIMVATDGHALLALRVGVEDPDGTPAVILPREVLESAAKGRVKDEVFIETGGERDPFKITALGVNGGQVWGGLPVDGRYPEWTRVIPSIDGDHVPAAFDPELMGRVCHARGLIEGKPKGKTGVYASDVCTNSNGTGVMPVAGENGLAVIMPLRMGKNSFLRPSWA